jgi:hypothetical protein
MRHHTGAREDRLRKIGLDAAMDVSSMTRQISESDWKLFRQLQPIALERFCERVLSEVSRLTSDTRKSSHERYLALFKLIKRRDRELADAFDDLRRSTALLQLARIQSHGLLTDEELARFSPETRDVVQFFLIGWQS